MPSVIILVLAGWIIRAWHSAAMATLCNMYRCQICTTIFFQIKKIKLYFSVCENAVCFASKSCFVLPLPLERNGREKFDPCYKFSFTIVLFILMIYRELKQCKLPKPDAVEQNSHTYHGRVEQDNKVLRLSIARQE